MKLFRVFKLLGQKLVWGWDDSDTWNLDDTLAEFLLPRLRRFRKITENHPMHMTAEDWDDCLGKNDLFSGNPFDRKLFCWAI